MMLKMVDVCFDSADTCSYSEQAGDIRCMIAGLTCVPVPLSRSLNLSDADCHHMALPSRLCRKSITTQFHPLGAASPTHPCLRRAEGRAQICNLRWRVRRERDRAHFSPCAQPSTVGVLPHAHGFGASTPTSRGGTRARARCGLVPRGRPIVYITLRYPLSVTYQDIASCWMRKSKELTSSSSPIFGRQLRDIAPKKGRF